MAVRSADARTGVRARSGLPATWDATLLAVHVSPRNWKVVHPCVSRHGSRPLGHGDALVLHETCSCFSPVFLIGAESLMSGRRVKGRAAITCDAAGALDAVAATGTLTSRGRRLTPWLATSAADEPIRSADARSLPGAPCRVGPPGPQSGASVAGRGGAQRSRLDQIRLNSAVK